MLFLLLCEYTILHFPQCTELSSEKQILILLAETPFTIPIVYFFYPETTYRFLGEVDTIFCRTKGWLDVVRVAQDEPRRCGKKGELIINYEQTEERAARSQGIVSGASAGATAGDLENMNKNSEVSSNVKMGEAV